MILGAHFKSLRLGFFSRLRSRILFSCFHIEDCFVSSSWECLVFAFLLKEGHVLFIHVAMHFSHGPVKVEPDQAWAEAISLVIATVASNSLELPLEDGHLNPVLVYNL